ncbi:MAG: T9SS type A sorting domain-containing protein [Paludibacteraceae bacterium]|nr:T9SS type A sorting domain-containing protein [Paludibacteraceae bacterium]
MKKLYYINKRVSRRFSATLLTLVASLLCATSLIADDWGFYETNSTYVWNVQFGYNNTNWSQHGDRSSNYSGDAELGVLTSDLYLDGFYAWCWGGSTTRYVRMYSSWKHNNGSFSSFSEEYVQAWDETGNKQIQTPSFSGTKKIFSLSSLEAGNYQYKYYLQITSDAGSTSDAQRYCSNNSNNMWVKFTVPGFIASDYSFGDKEKGSTTSYNYTFNSYGWTPAKVSLSGDESITFSDGTQSEKNVTISSDQGTVALKFAPTSVGSKSATLTLKGTYGGKTYTKKVTITGKVNPDDATTVLIAGDAKTYAGPEVELSGYLKYAGCDNTLLKRGFFFCEGSSCTPSSSSTLKAEIAGTTTLKAKDTFSKRFSAADNGTNLKSSTTYCYKSYVYSEAERAYVLSTETGKFTTPDDCLYSIGDTVYYTLDNTQEANACELRFQTLSAIAADMKKTHKNLDGVPQAAWWNTSTKMLTKPVVIEVAAGTYGNPDNATRDESLQSLNTTSISGSSPYAPTPTTTNYGLVIRAKVAGAKPVFQGGLSLVNARNVTLKGLMITRNKLSSATDLDNHKYSAVEIGYDDNGKFNSYGPGAFANSNISFINCEIDATAFCCIHAAACDGLKFDQCVFDMKNSDSPVDDDKNWGASVKLIGCKNVQFTRNSLKGSHATSLWLQHTQNVVVMNNVFWNDNLFTSNVAFVRPVVYGSTHNVQNIGVYYNTFYLADHAAAAYNVDFLRFGGEAQTGNASYYKADKIHFKWNNCYSYDDKISARNNDATAFLGVTLTSGNYDGNNFWSKGDSNPSDASTTSNLSFGTTVKHINVEEQVCQSSATDPDELVLKGSLLNIGAKPSTDISGLGVATDTNSDRFNSVIRSEAGGDWSYGAFQQATIAEIDTIVWVGGKSDAWDDRGNWTTTSGKRINCANTFSTNLHVIIPDADGVKNIPNIIEWASGDRGLYPDEYVAAGMGVGGNGYAQTSEFAKTMTIQEGGAIKGVENLFGDGTLRYEMADNRFTAIRSEWILVGGVIKPVKNGKVGDVTSGDFYIKDHLPHVYMQHFKLDEKSSIVPGVPFTSLGETVDANTAFGIYIPDQYGEFKLPAEIFYSYISPDPSKLKDGTANKTYTFKGRFANEASLPSYKIDATGLDKCVFVNNSYPANLDAKVLLADNSTMGLQAKVYNYKGKSWEDVDPDDDEVEYIVKPNNGFVLYATTSTGTVNTDIDEYVSGSTNYLKSASATTSLKLKATNTVDNTSSTVTVKYDGQNLPKAFSYNESTPEIYVPDGSSMYSTYGIDELTQVIPLSIRNQQSKSLSVKFELTKASGFESVILEDRLNGINYDLLEDGAAYCSGIAPGDCAGRFFLNINYADDEPTAVEESEADSSNDAGNIDIYSVNSGSVVISSSDNVMLEQVYITDMSGRTTVKALPDAHYNVLTLDGLQGVYVIKAVGDNASRTEKVIVK